RTVLLHASRRSVGGRGRQSDRDPIPWPPCPTARNRSVPRTERRRPGKNRQIQHSYRRSESEQRESISRETGSRSRVVRSLRSTGPHWRIRMLFKSRCRIESTVLYRIPPRAGRPETRMGDVGLEFQLSILG